MNVCNNDSERRVAAWLLTDSIDQGLISYLHHAITPYSLQLPQLMQMGAVSNPVINRQ